MVIGYAILLTYLSNLRGGNFYTAEWDLGINQQLLWTGAHGRLLYETADLSFYNAHSYLQVHSTYLALAVAPMYAAAPAPVTLFALQSSVFAASAVPLYLFARDVLDRPWLRLASVALYLGGFGVLSGLMFDFHWESFLPLEFLTYLLLVRRERFVASLIPFAIGTMTLEVFPFLAGGVLLLSLYERGEAVGWNLRRSLKDSRVRILVSLLLLALGAYVVVRLFQYTVVPDLLHVASTSGGSSGGIAGGTLGWAANTSTLPHSLGYWLLLLASFGFLPLLARRHLILSVPWFVYSVVIAPWFSHYFGTAYAMIAATPLAVAGVVGLGAVERGELRGRVPLILLTTIPALTIVLVVMAAIPGGAVRFLNYTDGTVFWAPTLLLLGATISLAAWNRRERSNVPHAVQNSRARSSASARRALPLVAALVVAILVFDAVMSPMNPANQGATPIPGYQFSWGENPMSSEMSWFTSKLPPGAQVLASNHLFPYVANDPNAWAVPWFVINAANPVPWFPFAPGNLPQYVLADASEMTWMPSFLAVDLFNTSFYGLVAYAFGTSYPGTVYLFERGYTGIPQSRVVTALAPQYELGPSNLTVGPAGGIERIAQSRFGQVIASRLSEPMTSSETGIWGGPHLSIVPGIYHVTFNLSGAGTAGSNASEPVLMLSISWTAGSAVGLLWQTTLDASQLTSWKWSDYSATFVATQPFPLVNFQGALVLSNGRPSGWVDLNSIELQTLSP